MYNSNNENEMLKWRLFVICLSDAMADLGPRCSKVRTNERRGKRSFVYCFASFVWQKSEKRSHRPWRRAPLEIRHTDQTDSLEDPS